MYLTTTPSRARRAIRFTVALAALAAFSATVGQAEARGRHKSHASHSRASDTADASKTGGLIASLFSGTSDKTTTGSLPPTSAKRGEGRSGASEDASPRAASSAPASRGATGTGIASYYGGSHHGGPTASGERFNQNAMTAAHRSAPLGSTMRVTNLNNGKSVVVRINDRGPFVRGRVIDVSRGAAEALGFVSAGLTRVKLDPV